MTLLYNRKEIITINRAFSAITEHINRHSYYHAQEWQDALKYERTRCSSLTAAKALIIENFIAGVRNPEPIHELLSIRRGCRFAHIYGSSLLEYGSSLLERQITTPAFDEICRLCDLAIEVKKVIFKRV